MWRSILAVLLIIGLLISGCGTKTTEIRYILRSPDDYYDQVVIVEGYVRDAVEWDWIQQSTDDFEVIEIPVRYTTEELPADGMGNIIKATGTVCKYIDDIRIEEYPYIEIDSWSYTN